MGSRAGPGFVAEATPESIDHLRGEYEQILNPSSLVLSTNGASIQMDFSGAVLLVLNAGDTIRHHLSHNAARLRTVGAAPTAACSLANTTRAHHPME